MIVLAFRTKLLLAMMLVVIGVTGATVFVTQDRVRRTYERVFRSQVEEQIRFFAELQEARLGGVRLKCLDLSRSVRLQAALEEGDAEVLYDRNNALSELRDIIGAPDAAALAAGLPARVQASFLAFLDGQGRIIAPPDAERSLLPAWVLRRLERTLPGLRATLTRPGDPQQLGHLPVPSGTGEERLDEVILTRISSQEDDRVLGALVVGFPWGAGREATGAEQAIQTGIWMEGRLHAQRVPPPIRQAVSAEMNALTAPAAGEGSVDLNNAGETLRVYFRRLNADSGFPPAYRVCLYSFREMHEEQERLLALIVAFGGVALVGALALSLVLSHGLAVPLHALVDGTTAIRQGNYTVTVPVRSRDEIGRLAESFNEMATGLAQKEKYRSVLDKVSDPAVADQLIHGGVELGGETREVSVLFCDIRGFTALTQGMAPTEVITMLNEHFTPLARVVNEHRGVVDKFVGDLIMAVFGAPKSYGDDAVAAARCARRMIEARTALNESSRYRIEVGIGVATGAALAGNMGSENRLNYTVLGERVNLASRLCSKAGRMEVVIDQTTRERLGAAATVEPMADLELKGFTGKVPAFTLLHILPA